MRRAVGPCQPTTVAIMIDGSATDNGARILSPALMGLLEWLFSTRMPQPSLHLWHCINTYNEGDTHNAHVLHLNAFDFPFSARFARALAVALACFSASFLALHQCRLVLGAERLQVNAPHRRVGRAFECHGRVMDVSLLGVLSHFCRASGVNSRIKWTVNSVQWLV